MRNTLILLFTLGSCVNSLSYSQLAENDTLFKRHYIGSSLFVLATPTLNPSPRFYQLYYGYRISEKDALSIEAITWEYRGPLGRPYGPDHDSESSEFPGKIRAYGLGLAYQRFLWKSLYAQVHATAFRQNYLEDDGSKIQSGFQLFNTFRLGYQFRFFKNKFFLEPSIAITTWPINTNLPDSFQVEEDKWNNFFIGEPGLHFGYNF